MNMTINNKKIMKIKNISEDVYSFFFLHDKSPTPNEGKSKNELYFRIVVSLYKRNIENPLMKHVSVCA